MTRVLVTGATGFIGRFLCERLAQAGYMVRAALHTESALPNGAMERLVVGDIGSKTEWRSAVREVDAVVHAAARAHVLNDDVCNADLYFETNTEGTRSLVRACADADVRRVIFLSSLKVNGEETAPGKPFKPEDAENPLDAYSLSKWEAESGLRKISAESGMEVVIIRPPLVYGPGVKANFLSMMRWLHKGLPLPFGAATHNRRSLVALENLVDLILTCIDHPSATNQTFFASDGEDLSTAELLIRLGAALERPARLISVPPSFLMVGARLVGRVDLARRLLGSLQVDLGKARDLLGWRPPLSIDRALEKTARHFLAQIKR